jgi:hypothetical protein
VEVPTKRLVAAMRAARHAADSEVGPLDTQEAIEAELRSIIEAMVPFVAATTAWIVHPSLTALQAHKRFFPHCLTGHRSQVLLIARAGLGHRARENISRRAGFFWTMLLEQSTYLRQVSG